MPIQFLNLRLKNFFGKSSIGEKEIKTAINLSSKILQWLWRKFSYYSFSSFRNYAGGAISTKNNQRTNDIWRGGSDHAYQQSRPQTVGILIKTKAIRNQSCQKLLPATAGVLRRLHGNAKDLKLDLTPVRDAITPCIAHWHSMEIFQACPILIPILIKWCRYYPTISPQM